MGRGAIWLSSTGGEDDGRPPVEACVKGGGRLLPYEEAANVQRAETAALVAGVAANAAWLEGGGSIDAHVDNAGVVGIWKGRRLLRRGREWA